MRKIGDIKEKLAYFGDKIVEKSTNTIEVVSLNGDNVDNFSQIVDKYQGTYENLGYGYGIITISVDNLEKLIDFEDIHYLELPKVLYTSDYYSNNSICVNDVKTSYNLTGEGVLVGFVDTGIDYTHKAFEDSEGNTRIEGIYDLELKKVFNKEIIEKAKKLEDPYSLVPSRDLAEHGTHVCGIACAGGKIPKENRGVCENSAIYMVKVARGEYTLSTQIMRGVKHLVDKSKELKKPLVINISMSTNDGAHNGTSLLERYIQTICDLERVCIVVASGNEGATSHHVGGILRDIQKIDLNVASDEASVVMAIYTDVLVNGVIQIVTPTGFKSSEINLKIGLNEVLLDKDKVIVYVSGPKPFDLIGEILVSLVATEEYLTGGVFSIILKSLNGSKGSYDIWLPISEGLNPKTKFLEPNLFNTVGIPGTVDGVITVGSYNSRTNNISSFSGRGKIFENKKVKPEIIAPGENILSSVVDNDFDTKSGTSMAAPHISGAVALMLEWGIVKKNDRFLYGERLKSFLVRGATRDRVDETYPNSVWGYGVACLDKTFKLLKEEDRFMRDEPIGRKIIEYFGDVQESIKKYKNASILILDPRVAILEAPLDTIENIIKETKEIIYVENSPVYTLNNLTPNESTGVYLFNDNPYIPLTGSGVLVGIIDTGIDYLNKEFRKEDDDTRILSLWDQSLETKVSTWHDYGQVFSKEDINNAIKAKLDGKNPYEIVNSRDEVGHGTMVAGIIGARGYDKNIKGAAPNCEFVVVKLKEASKKYLQEAGVYKDGGGKYENVDILLGIKHIIEEARNRLIPVVIYIPLGTNMGSHDGSSIIERYIDDLSKRRGLVVATCTGNEGDEDTHTEGKIERKGDIKTIELKVAENQSYLNFEMWFKKPDKVSIAIVSPSGEVIEKIPAKLKQIEEIRFVFEKTKMFIEYLIPEEITGDEVIRIKCSDLKPGIWQFRLIGDYIVDGRYDAWIPQRSLLQGETKFLNSSQYKTLQIPGTAKDILVSGFYNQNNTATIGKSGRGYTRDGRIKPDIAAPGILANVLSPGGEILTSSGASVGGAALAGCLALLMEWGIVQGNDPTMYSVKMKTYLTRGAKMREGDVYPNQEWGYGMLDMKGIFDNIRKGRFVEYDVDNLFVRLPKRSNKKY